MTSTHGGMQEPTFEQASYSRIHVEPCSGALGAEVSAVDLAAPLDPAVIDEIRRAFLEHQVLFFRNQKLTPAQQVTFGACFGELDTYPFIEPLPDQPEVIPIIKEKDGRYNFGGGWHSDTPYQEKPPKATMLYAIDVPQRGGDTLFANMYAAYDALSNGMRSIVGQLQGVHTASKVHGGSGYYAKADHAMSMTKDPARVEERYDHPVVRTHPETGRRALYVSVPHIERFAGMTRAESRPLLQFLGEHATKPEFTHRFRWRVGSLAVWDNRCVQHYAVNDYAGQRREMHRITVKGDVPF